MLSRLVPLLATLLLLSPCPACIPSGSTEPCVNFECGTYNMDGSWNADLHRVTWRVGSDGERENVQESDTRSRLLISSTGCGVTINRQIPALAQDDKLIIYADWEEPFDTEGNYNNQWSWRGECTIEKCYLDGEVTSTVGGQRQPTERGEFTFTNLQRIGE